jgi:protease-4
MPVISSTKPPSVPQASGGSTLPDGGTTLKAFFRTFFATLLALVVLIAVVVGVVAVKSGQKPKIKDHSYLVVDIYGEIQEYDPPCGVMSEMLGGEPETLHRILGNLEKAAVDDRIDGVVMKLSASNTLGTAMRGEVREAVKKVRASGKKVYAFTDYMDSRIYMVAAACDSIYMPSTAYINFTGFRVASTHFKGTLDKLGIKPNLHKIKDYKSAAELVTRSDMSPEAREMYGWMLDEGWDYYVSCLGEDRSLTEEQIIENMDYALMRPVEAVERGLVDRLLYWDELVGMLKREKDEKLRTVSMSRYGDEDPKDLGLKGKKKIAVVHAQGMIGGRKSKVDPVLGMLMGHESVNSDLRKAMEDDDVAAIVFRVNSGGGESLTSDMIGHQVHVAAQIKPVVVSMVNVAASGGYMISYRASKMVADPMTVTGSIGSISMKFNMKGLYDKLGMTQDYVTKGPKALLFSDTRDFTPEERARFEKNHWEDFNAWLADVAAFRGMTFEEAEKLAHGRIWSGRQAKENGLIDEVGGLDRAIEIAKELAEIPAEEKVTVVHYPEKKDLLDMILSGGGDGMAASAARWALYRFIREDLVGTMEMLGEGRYDYLADPIE